MDIQIKTPSHILLVDDERLLLDLLKTVFVANTHLVTLATSKKEAFELLGQNKFDLLIVDENLPDGSELNIIEDAQNLGFDGETIFITDYSNVDSAIHAISLGVFRYIKKPINLNSLRADIDQALETAKLRRSLVKRTQELEKSNTVLRQAMINSKEAEANRLQMERLAAVGYLAAGVAHEINNPLSLLSMSIPYAVEELKTLLHETRVNSDIDRVINSLDLMIRTMSSTEEAVEHLLSLSSDLHSLGKADPIAPICIQLIDPIASALRLVKHRFKHKALIVSDLPENIFIYGHPNRLMQVFTNLLTNAGRAIQNGNMENNQITIVASTEDQYAIIQISDTGIGIPDEHIDKIFEKFFTFSDSTTYEGSGLGLAIVNEIVTAHNGTINVSSVVNEGTTFTVKIPLANKQRSLSTIPLTIREETTTWTKTRRTLLFVDPDKNNLAFYEKSFDQLHDIKLSSTIEETIKIIEEQCDVLDAIICDLTFFRNSIKPKYGEQIHKIRERFILLRESNDQITLPTEKSFNILTKPIRPAALLAAIYKISPRNPSIS